MKNRNRTEMASIILDAACVGATKTKITRLNSLFSPFPSQKKFLSI
jgi:hypothetical protein